MRKLSAIEMSYVEGGSFWSVFKCALGLTLIAAGVVAALTGVGAAAAGGAIGGGAALANNGCGAAE